MIETTEPPQPAQQTPEHDYAGFWMRYGARVIDLVIIAFAIHSYYSYLFPFIEAVVDMYIPDVKSELVYSENTLKKYKLARTWQLYSTVGFSFVFTWLYHAAFESSYWRATPGKRLLGIWVTDEEGKRINFGTASARYFGKIISGTFLYIGFLMAGFTEKKQALHDRLAGTLVWKK